ncbi:EF-hand domain-containing protein [Primorskyibacter sp. S187A]|uniref:EF-hand domain-containing protein n=1 Tax=Primorskyibacter sp. S187A TaxID=3415130 RepID=UPI003C7AACCF
MTPKLITAFALTCVTAAPLLAMSDGMAALDANGDGMLSLEEMQVGYPEVTGDAFLTMDANADGMLDTDEVTAAETAGLLPAKEG